MTSLFANIRKTIATLAVTGALLPLNVWAKGGPSGAMGHTSGQSRTTSSMGSTSTASGIIHDANSRVTTVRTMNVMDNFGGLTGNPDPHPDHLASVGDSQYKSGASMGPGPKTSNSTRNDNVSDSSGKIDPYFNKNTKTVNYANKTVQTASELKIPGVTTPGGFSANQYVSKNVGNYGKAKLPVATNGNPTVPNQGPGSAGSEGSKIGGSSSQPTSTNPTKTCKSCPFPFPLPIGGCYGGCYGGCDNGGYCDGGYSDGGYCDGGSCDGGCSGNVCPAVYTSDNSDPAPVTTASATTPVAASGIDLVLENVTLAAPATLVAGPAYTVTFRNQGTADAGRFQVAVLAGLDGKLAQDAPRGVVEVPALAAGEAKEIMLRLPQKALKFAGPDGEPVAFTQLFVAVDLTNAVPETDKSNNTAIVERAALEAGSAAN